MQPDVFLGLVEKEDKI